MCWQLKHLSKSTRSILAAGHSQHANLLVGLAGVYFHHTEQKVESRSSVEENERRPVALVRICNL
jgi:hypothetical protein